ncbi:MAG: EamA family transporter [Desulfobacteraceae bacterium]|nr:EamA family transporter [Desulfobacteraceae bacterium]
MKLKTGYLYVVMAAICWASSGSASKFLFNAGVSPNQLVQIRVTIACIALFLGIGLFSRNLLRISFKDLPYVMFLGIFGMAAVQYTYLLAISKINVASAILLQYQAPVLIILFSVFVLKEKVSKLTLAAIVVSTAGCYLVVGGYDLALFSMNRVGAVAGLLSACAFAFYSMYGEYGMRKYNPITITFYAMLVAAVLWNLVQKPFSAFQLEYTANQWGWIFFIGIFGGVVPFTLYFKGVSLIRSARAGITATLEPIAAGLIAYLFLGESMEPLQIAGAVLVIMVIIVLQLNKEEGKLTPEQLRRSA